MHVMHAQFVSALLQPGWGLRTDCEACCADAAGLSEGYTHTVVASVLLHEGDLLDQAEACWHHPHRQSFARRPLP
jgi:hypothetical protein